MDGWELLAEEEKKDKERLEEIERELRRMQKERIDMYEKVIRMINEK